jgi:hypothetical protein
MSVDKTWTTDLDTVLQCPTCAFRFSTEWSAPITDCPMCTLTAVRATITTWLGTQGHDRCHYYPELFQQLADALHLTRTDGSGIPDRAAFEAGCRRFADDLYGPIPIAGVPFMGWAWSDASIREAFPIGTRIRYRPDGRVLRVTDVCVQYIVAREESSDTTGDDEMFLPFEVEIVS